MNALPLNIGPVHFVGIGGIGMSGIAETMHNLGYRVRGSDLSDNSSVARLRSFGIAVEIGHAAANLADAQVVVVSTAVKADNPEIVAARARHLPIVHRAEMLGELMRFKWSVAVSGTHGKTTTTSMVAALLDAAGMDPTVVNGGIINAYGSNARLGTGDWMVVEADESDGSFLKLPATIAVVTNIDPEHLEHYGSFDRIRDAFVAFVEKVPFYGFAALCLDHPEVQALIPRVSDRRLRTYGFHPQADIKAVDLKADRSGTSFAAVVTDPNTGATRRIEDLRLRVLGEHNVQNSLAIVAIAQEMPIDDDVLRRAIGEFAGVKRRFTRTGESGGVTVIDDYGHHPVEIMAVLKAARSAATGRVIAVMQPHRYTRLSSLFDGFCTCFNDADTVIVSHVYAAGETPIDGVDRDALVDGLRARGHRSVVALDDPAELAATVAGVARSGDLVVCLGAGTITNWAHALPQDLDKLRSSSDPVRLAGASA